MLGISTVLAMLSKIEGLNYIFSTFNLNLILKAKKIKLVEWVFFICWIFYRATVQSRVYCIKENRLWVYFNISFYATRNP